MSIVEPIYGFEAPKPTEIKKSTLKFAVTQTAVGKRRYEELTGRESDKAHLQKMLKRVQVAAHDAERRGEHEYARILRTGMYKAIGEQGFTVLDGRVV